MPFSTPALADTISAIQADISTRLGGADATLPRGFLPALARAQGGAVDGLYGFIEYLGRQIPYDRADEDLLRRWAAIWGVLSTPPTAASGQGLFSGTSGSVVPAANTLLTRDDGVQYALTADVVLAAGVGAGTLLCTSVGAATNLAGGTTLTLVSPVPGVSGTVTVGPAGLGGGADVEGVDSLRSRLLMRIQQPPMGGSAADFVRWVLAVPGVTRAWCLPSLMGAGTVGVTFMMDGRDNPIPLPADVAAVQAAVDAVRPVAAPTFYVAPVAVPLNPIIHLMPDSLAARAAVQARLTALLAIQAPGATAKLTHVQQAIGAAAGVDDYVLVSPIASLPVGATQIVTLGAITWQ